MKFKLQLICEPGENEIACTDEIFTFDKPFDTFENIGLSLCESKQLLKSLQQSIVEKQLGAFIKNKGLQKLRKKETIPLNLRHFSVKSLLKAPDIMVKIKKSSAL